MLPGNCYEPKKHFFRNSVIIPVALRVIGLPLVKINNTHCKRYKPKSKTFLLVANHNDILDPGYEMISLGQYIRYVSSDHVVRDGFMGKFLNFFGTPIVKYRDHPREELTENIIKTLKAGVSVGIHAEGGTSFNGETRYISFNTARLVKDSGCALITYCSHGGYLRSPRWKKHKRKGHVYGEVVKEYSREEISGMTEDEIYKAICKDLYVNAYDDQRKDPHSYVGDDLAESCEIILYRCPVCNGIGTLHSLKNHLSCDCGYKLEMRPDGFFHSCGDKVVFDNICDWEHWQRESMREYLDNFKGDADAVILQDKDQILAKIENGNSVTISEHALLELYCDHVRLKYENSEHFIPFEKIKRMDYVKRQTLLIVAEDDYFEINSDYPRSVTKYIDAWRYLTGRQNC